MASEAASTLPEHPRSGEIVEGYEILGLVAGGGMGAVYLARRRRAGGFEKRLAMKVLHPHLASDPMMIAMFLDEARIASQIAHPNVVAVIDTGSHRGLPWLVMELIDGRSLAEVETERPPAPWVAHVLAQAARGLHAAHEAKDADGRPLGIVHRDVSPQNVLVALDGTVKVVDFGIAAAQGRLAHTATGELKGKLGYLAPEQLAEPRRRVDRRVDVWAFGVTAWECFAQRRLFDAENAQARIRQLETLAIPSLRSVVPGIDETVADLVARCLERDPERRLPALDALASELARVGERGGIRGAEDVARWMRAHFPSRVRPSAPADEVTARDAGEVALRNAEPAPAGASEVRRTLRWSRARAARTGAVAVVAAAIAAGAAIAMTGEEDTGQRAEPDVIAASGSDRADAPTRPVASPAPEPASDALSSESVTPMPSPSAVVAPPPARAARARRTAARAPASRAALDSAPALDSASALGSTTATDSAPARDSAPAAEAPSARPAPARPEPRLLPSPYGPE